MIDPAVKMPANFALFLDMAGLLGDAYGERRRWVRAEWGGIWGGVSPLQPAKGSGERRELPQRGPKTDFGVF